MYVVRLPYEKFDDPTNPSLKYLESLTVPQDGTPQEKAKIQALKNIAKEFTTGGKQTAWPAHAKLYDMQQQGTASHKNLMVYRYAEMLLLMADTYNELGKQS